MSDALQPASKDPARTPPRRPWWRRVLRGLGLYVGVPYLAIVVLLVLFQRTLIYPAGRAERLPAADAGVPDGEILDVEVTTGDDLTLHGWLYLTGGQTAETAGTFAKEKPADARLLISLHGNAGHRGHRVTECREFTRMGFHVLMCDYRGYAENEGSPSEAGLQSDADAIWNFATERLKFPPSRIVLFGESLGGAVATALAARLCGQKSPPAALVLNSTFASLPGVAAWHYPFIPARFLLFDRWPSAERIKQVTCPILIFHAGRDEIVPLEQGRRLFAAAPEQSAGGVAKKFVPLPAANHNGIPAGVLRQTMAEFLAKAGMPMEP